MTIVRYEPWSLFDRLSRQNINPHSSQNTGSPVSFIPAVDVLEEKDRYVVRADLPGVGREDIEVSTDDGVLTLKGERRSEARQSTEGFARTERVSGSFVRRFTLPETAQVDGIKAAHVNGVLEVTIPKQARPEARRVNVEAA